MQARDNSICEYDILIRIKRDLVRSGQGEIVAGVDLRDGRICRVRIKSLWCKPGETKLGEDQRPARCLEEWEWAYDFWKTMQEEEL